MEDQGERIDGGFIVLARKILDSEIWEKPVSWIAIWIHILLKVNWKDTPRMKMAQGYFSWPTEKPFLKGVTERQWGNVLLWLKNKEMIKKQKKKLGCIITVCNYERYQDPSLYGKGTKEGKKKELKGNKKGTLIKEEGKKENKTSIWLIKFEEFWKVYPKRKSKGDARKAWFKLQPSDHLFNKIISTLERAKASHAWTKDGGQFVPYPATWLNNEGWDDEISTEEGGSENKNEGGKDFVY